MAQTKGNGIVVGVVSTLEDPENIGRVRVTYPHLGDKTSDWARLVTLMGGGERGVFFRPEIGDEVLVGFEHGDVRRPYILGGLWSKEDKPPADDGNAKENNWRFIRSRSGHVVKLDDTEGAERIEIVDKDEARRVVIDTSGTKIMIECDSGDIDIKASGTVLVKSDTVKVEATTADVSATSVAVKASGTMDLEGATVNIKGSSMVNINA